MTNVVQLSLAMRDRDRAEIVATGVRRAITLVADAIGRKQLADDWDCTETNVGNKLNDAPRHPIHLAEVIDLVLRDRDLLILGALTEAAGCEAPERKRVLEPGEKLSRIEAAASELFGPDVLDLLRRKAGL